MKTAKDFPIGFAYGATDGEYYYTPTAAHPRTNLWVGNSHKGDDYYAPENTPVMIGSTVIGLTGATGKVGGPHLHVQAGTDAYAQQVINPRPYAFKGGIVTATGYADQWGNYIIIRVGKVYVVYAHLNKTNVSVGQNISEVSKEENMKVDLTTARVLAYTILGDKTALTGKRDGDLNKNHVGKELTAQYISSLFNSAEAKGARANDPSEKLSKIREIVK